MRIARRRAACTSTRSLKHSIVPDVCSEVGVAICKITEPREGKQQSAEARDVLSLTLHTSRNGCVATSRHRNRACLSLYTVLPRHVSAVTLVSANKQKSFCASLGRASRQEKLQSSHSFGPLRADLPTCIILSVIIIIIIQRSVFFADTGIGVHACLRRRRLAAAVKQVLQRS